MQSINSDRFLDDVPERRTGSFPKPLVAVSSIMLRGLKFLNLIEKTKPRGDVVFTAA